jgi:hypothetical protein
MDQYKIYRMKPAPVVNSQGRLDGQWIVTCTRYHLGVPLRPRVVARFYDDGRDACEAWSRRNQIPFDVRMEVR